MSIRYTMVYQIYVIHMYIGCNMAHQIMEWMRKKGIFCHHIYNVTKETRKTWISVDGHPKVVSLMMSIYVLDKFNILVQN
jgi:hypothetical protein